MFTWFLVLALIWPAFWLLRVGLIARVLLSIEFRPEKLAPVSAEQIPSHLAEAAAPQQVQLQALGFRLLGGWQVQRFLDPALDNVAMVFTHETLPVRAFVQPHELATRSGECSVSLRTTTAEGFEIITTTYAPEEIVVRPVGIELEAVATDSMPELLARHRVRIAVHEAAAWRCVDLAGAATREQYVCDAVFAQQRAQGDFTEQADGSLSYRIGPALRRASHLIRAAAKQLKAEKKRVAAAPPPVTPLREETQATFDYTHYRQMAALTRGRLSARTKTIVSIVSFVVFAAVLAWRMSPVIAISLLVSLVIHEGGHLLGMRWFGYRDTQLLFIPFFGGAAIGHDDKVLRPWQHIVIILLGPLPGIFLGLAIAAVVGGSGAPWINQAALTMVAMNAFNLLPILPLDGGQIVDFAVAAPFPRARVLFLAFSACALLVVSLTMDGLMVLTIVAGLALIRLPLEWKLARMRREIRLEFPDGADEESIVRRLLVRFRQPEWRKVSMSHRLVNARALQQVLRMPRPGFGTMAFAVFGYTAPLWGGAPLALWMAHRDGQAVVRRAEEKLRVAGITRTPPANTARISAEDNGAIPYARAAALAKSRPALVESSEADAAIVALLHEAANKSAFVPVAGAMPATTHSWQEQLSSGRIAFALPGAAQAKMRFGEPKAAALLLIDALRLQRLMDTSPGWQTWSTRQHAMNQVLTALEELLANTGSSAMPADSIESVRALINERHEMEFAVREMPFEFVHDANLFEEMQRHGNASAWRRFWGIVASVAIGADRERAKLMEQAIDLAAQLKEIEAGKWPALPVPDAATVFSQQSTVIAQLGDLLTRMRQCRVALAVVEHRARGHAATTFNDLGIPPTELRHPQTLEPLRWVRRGALDVLVFQPALARLVGENGPATESVWRLPGSVEHP